MSDTIFALSSGAPPAAISVVRVSGPEAGLAIERLAGAVPAPRRASLRRLSNSDGETLDCALVLWLPGPGTSTGEDMVELHLHGGRAVVAAVESALGVMPELRRATSGEFTRRAFVNGRIDLAEAEGLADLLFAETELQRKSAMAMAGGGFSRQVEQWRDRLLAISAIVEAALDFGDEDDVSQQPAIGIESDIAKLVGELENWLVRPRAETLRDGFKVVLAGPPNAGKSTLFNALVESEAAITAPTAGTTRDVLTRSVAISGVPFVFVDTAGLHDCAHDPVEKIGIDRARSVARDANLVLWLGPEGEGPAGAWEIATKADIAGQTGTESKARARHIVSGLMHMGLDELRADLIKAAENAMPRLGDAALNQRQATLLARVREALRAAMGHSDPLLVAEELRVARVALDSLVGRAATEDMLDALFGRFCIGK